LTVVRAESAGAVDVLTLDSPANRNALSLALMEELLAGIRASRGRALVLDHTGTVFCAGVDLRERAAGGDRARHDRKRHTRAAAQREAPPPREGRAALVRGSQ